MCFRKNEHPKKAPPSFYQVTNHSKERPDVWIESPEKLVFSLSFKPILLLLKQKNPYLRQLVENFELFVADQ